MPYFKPIKTMICSTLIASLAMSTTATLSNQAHADTDYYYRDGLNYPSDQQAYQKTKKISKSSISIQHYTKANQNNLKAIGRVSNMNGHKGKGKDSMGTGTVIGDHTLITNAHVIDDKNGKAASAKYITFAMNRDGKHIPYKFHASNVKKLPHYDIAIVHTKEKMSKYAKPIRIASDKEINSLKFNTPLYSLGYPWQNGDNTKAYYSQLRFTQFSANGTEIMTKDIFRAGASGSPMLDSKYSKIYGLRTYGYNLWNNSTDKYAKQEMAGGESFKGKAGQFVKDNIK